MAVRNLIDALERAAVGEEVSPEFARSLSWDASDQTLDHKARESWRRLVNFADDGDIRCWDEKYSKMLRDEMRWRAGEFLAEICKKQSRT